MLAARTVLAVAMAICGTVILVRLLPFGLRLETLPGLVLAVAMIALGVHRLTLIARARRGAS